MICICYQRQLELLAAFQSLSSNVGTNLAVPADLMPAVGSMNSAMMNASAALAAAPAGGPEAAAASTAATSAALSASPALEAAAQLAALASAAGAANAGLGVDMTSPSGGASCASLMSMLPELIKTLAQLPLFLQPKLAELAQIGELVEKMKQSFGVDLDAPSWAEDLSDSVQEKLDEAKQQAEDALAGAGGKPPALPLDLLGLLSSSTTESVGDSISNTVASTNASVQTGLGVDMTAPGALDALGKKLGAVKGSMAGASGSAEPLDLALVLTAMQTLASIDVLRRTLGIDVLAPGAGGSLQALLNSLSSNLATSGAASAAGLNGAASTAASTTASLGSGAGGSSSSSASGSASTDVSTSSSMGATAGGAANAAASAGLAALAGSPLANPALAQMMAGMPGMPMPLMLLTALSAQTKSTLGIELIAHGPCE
ncbi:MAG: hypothetical protein ABI054_08955 [Planctomycetota bacterium]